MVPPDSQKISPSLESELTKSFGGVAQFQEKFETVGASHFGSGWVWLSMDKDGRLDLASYANQDCPAMSGKTPLLGNDLWEHAYYLSYRNRRAEYLKAWWRVVSWRVVEQRINEARADLK
jgi:Fe-Mn family superoxide dismutase